MANRQTLPEIDILLTIRTRHRPGVLGRMLTLLGESGALAGEITTEFVGNMYNVRKIVLSVYDEAHLEEVKAILNAFPDAELLNVEDMVYKRHLGGKIHSGRRGDISSVVDMRYVYTPGVARVCRTIEQDPQNGIRYTSIPNTVGIFTNGTRVLGLGDIGPLASMPVMEGKAMIYDQFVGLSAVPILVDTKDPEEFVNVVEKVAPTFGGIHLEDIKAPDCFYIEEELIRRLKKPVFHDDQHGTATVTLAAVMSLCRLLGLHDKTAITVTQIGLGAAGYGIGTLLLSWGVKVIGVDPNPVAQKRFQAAGGQIASLDEAMKAARIVVATTGVVGLIQPEMVQPGQAILALSNPMAEIAPEVARAAGASYASDGKVVNNALAYPALFKAALQLRAESISTEMKVAAAAAISSFSDPGELAPSPFKAGLHQAVVQAVIESQQAELSFDDF